MTIEYSATSGSKGAADNTMPTTGPALVDDEATDASREPAKPRVLIVDDSRAMRMVLGRLMKQRGFEVIEADHGGKALDTLATVGPVELMLVDWNMPVMNGIELVGRVRDNPVNMETRILMVTTESQMRKIIDALETGADEYLMKPFTPESLGGKLDLLGFGTALD